MSEQVSITINGELAGTISVDAYHPKTLLKVEVPEPGKQSYLISATAVFMNEYGYQRRLYGTEQGNIYISDGENLALMGHWSGNTWLVSLRKV